MKLFDVYPLFDIEPEKASGSILTDTKGNNYLDLYGGHAVISVGHSHPHYIKRLEEQLHKIGFYSNSVKIPQQEVLANRLGKLSGYDDYSLFLCNSGAEANENALKLASFHNKRKKIIAFNNSFHGRTSLAVAATDDARLKAEVNLSHSIQFLPINDFEAAEKAITEEISAVIIEGIQGVGGVLIPDDSFLGHLRNLCTKTGALLILDEVQSGYGRSGKFFAHQYSGVKPDLITIAKGMGNGFPVAGVLISPEFESRHGMLGTTFGGNYLACAAAIAVLEIIENENLVLKAGETGNFILSELSGIPGIKEIRGRGLMIGIELDQPCSPVRNSLLYTHNIFTGGSSNPNTIRILPALNLALSEAEQFIQAIKVTLK